MGKVAVIYATMTRHSQKVAAAIGAALAVSAENVRDNPVLGNVDLLFVVGGLYGNESRPELVKFIADLEKSQVKEVVLVTTSAAMKRGQEGVRQILAEKGITVADELLLRGSFFLWHMGRPNKDDIAAAVKFAREKAGC